MNPGWTIRTGRLLLLPVGWQDLAGLQALKADPSVFAQMLGGVRTAAQATAELAEDVAFWGKHGVGIWSIRQLAQSPLLGMTGVHERPDGRGFGLRFALSSHARGHGFAREAAGAALRFAHEQVGLNRIVAVARETNLDSRTVLGAIGMRPTATFERGGERMLVYESVR